MSAKSPESAHEPQGQPSGQQEPSSGQLTGDELEARLADLDAQITAHLEGLRKK
ncbi:hypothetical protein JJV70_04435 [Streptomyces sp. JJ66]|uniref:hypothetical protein n=1 Tax=Streptomyces sp. JJ66 TaxID=2803843 RepID=UPI001C57C6B8|nr:hypothetical protein [Streptomyces sp. JJ66]MBW1601363.1 hypothetical protein [Streptomyces sp. JJ66]